MEFALPHHPAIHEFETARLRLRQWHESDREPFAALNADPLVMRYFPSQLSRAESDRLIDLIQADLTERGWGLWAVEVQATAQFIGFVGLSVPRRALPFMPCVEIGWRLAQSAWGHGYATEAAKQVLAVGFVQLGLAEIVSFTSLLNQPSRAVMERIGMQNANEDFDHPALPEGHPLRRHCLYRLRHHGGDQ
jgi:RimJ/RimL family protein N-acetyltransferase